MRLEWQTSAMNCTIRVRHESSSVDGVEVTVIEYDDDQTIETEFAFHDIDELRRFANGLLRFADLMQGR